MLGADVPDHRRVDRYLGFDLEGATVAGVEDEPFGTAAGDGALEK
jgi:hypothetical protein